MVQILASFSLQDYVGPRAVQDYEVVDGPSQRKKDGCNAIYIRSVLSRRS